MAGVSVIADPASSSFKKRSYEKYPGMHFPVVEEIVESDMAQHPCCAIPRKVFFEIEGEDEALLRGLDPLLRYKIRKAGYRIVIVPHAWIYHTIADNMPQLVKKMFRNGSRAYWGYRIDPECIIDAPGEGASEKQFTPKHSRAFRVARSLLALLRSLLTFKLIDFSARISYIAGYVYAMTLRRNPPQ